MTFPRALLIDADILLYQAVCQVERETLINDLRTPEAEYIKESIVASFITSLDGSDISIIWSDISDANHSPEPKDKRVREEVKG